MEKINPNAPEEGPLNPDKAAESLVLRLINDIKNYSQTIGELNKKLEELKEESLSSMSYFDTDETTFSLEELKDTPDSEMKAQRNHFEVDNREEMEEKINEVEEYIEKAQESLKVAKKELDLLIKN
ncbi:MAG: hypothetical protein WDZ70_00160 [Candidatus Paceibacterota bacterium]